MEVRGVVSAKRSGKVELRGSYGELVSHPLARLFDAHTPGDHVRVEIRGFGLFAGDAVTVTGEVLEERVAADRDPSGDGGLREAPRTEPAVIGAERITLGHEREDARRPPEGPRSAALAEPARPPPSSRGVRSRRPRASTSRSVSRRSCLASCSRGSLRSCASARG
jgi:hypothetical protein